VMLGLTMAGRRRLARWPKFAIEDVHRFGGLLVGSFVVLHVVTIAIDAYLPFPLASLVVPGLSRYRPIWVALGIVAAELLLALAFTNRYRNRLVPYAVWRRAHYLNFVVWPVATLHGLGSGTDRNAPWLLAIYTAAAASVAATIAWRFLRLRPLVAAAGLGTAGLVIGLATGPLRVPPRPWNAGTFSGALAGYVDVGFPGLKTHVIMVTGVGGGRQRVWVRADILLQRVRGVLGSSFRMEYLPSGLLCSGRVTHVEAFAFRAHCRTATGLRRVVDVHWKPSDSLELKDGVIASRGETAAPGEEGRSASARAWQRHAPLVQSSIAPAATQSRQSSASSGSHSASWISPSR
jgi:methionine sulfoxide reductase heme-binding subunit